MREEQSRRQQFTQGSVSTLLPPSVAGKQGSLLLQEETSSSSVVINLDSAMMQAVQDDTVSFIVNIITILFNINYNNIAYCINVQILYNTYTFNIFNSLKII